MGLQYLFSTDSRYFKDNITLKTRKHFYCVDFCCQAFLKGLNPLGDMTEKMFNDYLYGKSLELEPRNAKQLPKCVSTLWFSLLRILVGGRRDKTDWTVLNGKMKINLEKMKEAGISN